METKPAYSENKGKKAIRKFSCRCDQIKSLWMADIRWHLNGIKGLPYFDKNGTFSSSQQRSSQFSKSFLANTSDRIYKLTNFACRLSLNSELLRFMMSFMENKPVTIFLLIKVTLSVALISQNFIRVTQNSLFSVLLVWLFQCSAAKAR